MIVLLCLIGLLSSSLGQLISRGRCPVVPRVADFDEKKLFGDWYEGWRIDNKWQPGFQCSSVYFFRDKEGVITEELDAVIPAAGVKTFWQGKFIPLEGCETGQYNQAFASYATDTSYNTTFADADWESWVLHYGCTQKGHYRYQFLWVYVKDIYNCDVDAIADAVERLEISFDDLMQIDYENCP